MQAFCKAAHPTAPAAVLQVPRQSPIAATINLNPQAWEEDEQPGPKSKADTELQQDNTFISTSEGFIVNRLVNWLASSSAMLQEQLHLQGQISLLCHLNPYPSSAHSQRLIPFLLDWEGPTEQAHWHEKEIGAGQDTQYRGARCCCLLLLGRLKRRSS